MRIRLAWRGGRLAEVAGATRRPAAAVLLRGKAPEQAAALVPLVFSLCGRAQQAACRAAGRAAAGEVGGEVVAELGAGRAALLAEAGQEHLWRLLLDWPRLLGLPAAEAAFAGWHRQLTAWGRAAARAPAAPAGGSPALADELPVALARYLEQELLGLPSAELLAGAGPAPASLGGQLLARLPVEPALPAHARPRLLPVRPAAAWAADAALADPVFASAPRWGGAPAETGALARQAGRPAVAAALAAGQGLRARLLARLCDLADLPARLQRAAVGGAGQLGWLAAASAAPGVGVACVETARGLLLHHLRLGSDGRIADYGVIAPSEWNFHPDGAWRQELLALAATACEPAAAEACARQLVLALDPCVPLDLEFAPTEPHHA